MLLLIIWGYFLRLNLWPWQRKLTSTELVFAKNTMTASNVCSCVYTITCALQYVLLLFICMSTVMDGYAYLNSSGMFRDLVCWSVRRVWMKLSVCVFKTCTMWCRRQYLKCSTIFPDLGRARVARAAVRLLARSLLISSPCSYRAAVAGPGAKPILFDGP